MVLNCLMLMLSHRLLDKAQMLAKAYQDVNQRYHIILLVDIASTADFDRISIHCYTLIRFSVQYITR